jgi:ACR3 family arsenite efflux pump ArsB
MAQTKRKRQTKHRGTAAGSVTQRGRTSKPVSANVKKQTTKKANAEARLLKKPTWEGSAKKAILIAMVMLALLLFTSKGNVIVSIGLAIVVTIIYVPLAYYIDMYTWRRRMIKRGLPLQ